MAASAKGVRAGKAFVELFADSNQLTRGLAAAGRQLKAWGAAISAMGAKVFMGGAGLLTGLGLATKIFGDLGSSLIDASDRTGIAVEELSALAFAAAQAGSNFEELEAAIGKMQKFIVSAAEGSSEARKALRDLGLSARDLSGMTADKQLEAIADAIKEIDNPAKRSAVAVELFGKAGRKLLPLLKDGSKGLRELIDEAKAVGAVMSREDAEAADRFGDSIDALKASLKFMVAMVGGALAPALTDLAKKTASYARAASDWLKQNRGLVVSVAKMAAVVAAAGASLYLLGMVVGAIGAGLAIIKIALAAALWYITANFTKLGLIYWAIRGMVTAWVLWSDTGKEAGKNIFSMLMGIRDTAVLAWGGIVDAIMSGDVALAAQIAFKALQLAWRQTTSGMNATWDDMSYGIADSLLAAWSTIKFGWAIVVGSAKAAWARLLFEMQFGWANFVDGLHGIWLRFLQVLGFDVAQQRMELATRNAADNAAMKAGYEKRMDDIRKEFQDKAGPGETERTRDALAQDKRAKRQQNEDASKAEIDRLRGELEALNATAKEKREKQAAEMANAGGGMPPKLGSESAGSVGSFSAASFRGQGFISVSERLQADANRILEDLLKTGAKQLEELRKGIAGFAIG